jgi:pantoate--beta-alanine ligase
MRIESRISGVRAFVAAARREGKSVGLVPTMGAFHQGHLSLMRRSAADNGVTVVSLFLNPTQFGPQEDLSKYPRDLEGDARQAREAGVSLIFAPETDEMYTAGACTWVTVEGLTEGLCGTRRPGHFRGVATVVAKLLNIVQPDRAYFGEKDYQQLQVIRRMVRDLDLPVDIVPQPIVREADGLALSSRNAYLSLDERRAAPRLAAALRAGAELAREGATGGEAVQRVREMLAEEPLLKPQYVEAVDPESLRDRSEAGAPLLLAAAVYAGKTRLIDNVRVNG